MLSFTTIRTTRTSAILNTIRKATIMTDAPAKKWFDAYPPPSQPAPVIKPDTVRQLLEASSPPLDEQGKPLILVDVRRNDFMGGTIKGSLNLPAETQQLTQGVLYELMKRGGGGTVAWYCGSSNGRGPRAAGWFADYVRSQGGEENVKSVVLEGGIKRWVKRGWTESMVGFDAAAWEGEK